MAISVNLQNNPVVSKVGKTISEATVITSGFNAGAVEYYIEELTHRENGHIIDKFSISTVIDASTLANRYPQVVSCNVDALSIILPFRKQYRVKVRQNAGAWSAWTNFKTRTKLYSRPGAITELSETITYDSHGANVVVTNSGKAVESRRSGRTYITNSDKTYAGTTSIVYNSNGAIVVNDNVFANPSTPNAV